MAIKAAIAAIAASVAVLVGIEITDTQVAEATATATEVTARSFVHEAEYAALYDGGRQVSVADLQLVAQNAIDCYQGTISGCPGVPSDPEERAEAILPEVTDTGFKLTVDEHCVSATANDQGETSISPC